MIKTGARFLYVFGFYRFSGFCERNLSQTAGSLLSGRKLIIVERLWRKFFSDPSQWWDHRSEKVNPRYPDFKHKWTQKALWLIDDSNPPWVETKLAAIAPGTLQSDSFSWNTRLRRYAKAGDYGKTISLFKQMQQEGMNPDKFTFVPVLNACSGLLDVEEGRLTHLQIIKSGLECDVFVGSCLVDMYAKFGRIKDARRIFDKMHTKDVVAWTAMILGYGKCEQGQEALELARQMQLEGVNLNPVTFVGVLNACASTAALEEGMRAHEQIIDGGYESDVYVANSLIDMYSKCGSIENAQKVFNKMPTRNVVSWSAMLAAYGLHGCGKEALEEFVQMCQEGIEVNGVTFVSLLSACGRGGLVDEGMHYFESMSAIFSISSTVEHYACIVDLLGRAGRLHQAEDLIRSMPCEPDVTVWMSLIGACRAHGNLEMGECGAKRRVECDPENPAGYVLLSNIYAVAGKWDRVQEVHQERLERHVDNISVRSDRQQGASNNGYYELGTTLRSSFPV